MPDRFTVIANQTLEGPLLIEPASFGDDRGFFAETYRRNEMMALGIEEEMVQDNHSRSARGVVRGMHFHIGRGVTKLVRCGRGSIVDVLVDLRYDDPAIGIEWPLPAAELQVSARDAEAPLLADVADSLPF